MTPRLRMLAGPFKTGSGVVQSLRFGRVIPSFALICIRAFGTRKTCIVRIEASSIDTAFNRIRQSDKTV